MKLYIENIGKINKAEIDFNGLTLIASENNAGKSTVGKIIYVTTKVMNNMELLIKRQKSNEINDYFRLILSRFENNLRKMPINEEGFDYLQTEKYDNNINFDWNIPVVDTDNKFFEVRSELTNLNILLVNHSFKRLPNSNHDNYIKRLIKLTYDNRIYLSDYDFDFIINIIKKMENLLDTKDSVYYSRVFEAGFRKEFGQQLLNINSTNGVIIIKENDNEVLNLEVTSDYSSQFKTSSIKVNVYKNIYSSDVTYIESPYIFNDIKVDNSINLSHLLLGKNNDLITKNEDLKEKLIVAKEISFISEINISNILIELEKVIGGTINYDSELGKFEYKNDSETIEFVNTASGIKQFALIIMLIKNNRIRPMDILIMDEPEVHLHPSWQICLAEILVMLCKQLDLRIFINSHSSYFIEALNLYSKKHNIKDRTEFYAFDYQDNQNRLSNVTNSLSFIFNRLNKPYDILDDVAIDDALEGLF